MRYKPVNWRQNTTLRQPDLAYDRGVYTRLTVAIKYYPGPKSSVKMVEVVIPKKDEKYFRWFLGTCIEENGDIDSYAETLLGHK